MVGSVGGCEGRRTLTSAWIETWFRVVVRASLSVALSRVRGLKLSIVWFIVAGLGSHSHECVD